MQYYSNVTEKKKQRKVISVLKVDRQALCLFVEKYPEKQEAFKYLLKSFPLAISILEGKLYQPKAKCLFISYLIKLSNAKVKEIIAITNPIVIYDAMAIVHLVTSKKTWESLLQTSVKPFRLQEAEETLLVFDNYSDNQEFSLKEQERINRVTNGTVRAYMEENAQVMPQGKAYQQYLENTENTFCRTTYAQN